jgi:hypothetical protein
MERDKNIGPNEQDVSQNKKKKWETPRFERHDVSSRTQAMKDPWPSETGGVLGPSA